MTGTLLGIQALTPLMPPGGGSIVIVGSVAALTGHYPVAYTASKWALRGLTKAACLELGSARSAGQHRFTPGYIETPMTASASDAFRDANVDRDPAGPDRHCPTRSAPLVRLPDQRRIVLHHRRGDPRRRRDDGARRRQVDQRRGSWSVGGDRPAGRQGRGHHRHRRRAGQGSGPVVRRRGRHRRRVRRQGRRRRGNGPPCPTGRWPDEQHPPGGPDGRGRRSAEWINGAAADHGGIDILYNNAGATRFSPIDQMSYAGLAFVLRQ